MEPKSSQRLLYTVSFHKQSCDSTFTNNDTKLNRTTNDSTIIIYGSYYVDHQIEILLMKLEDILCLS